MVVNLAAFNGKVADVSVCGAVQPDNEFLGGKLVVLLLTSAEVRDAYACVSIKQHGKVRAAGQRLR
ncbi:hypothetical protein AJ87_20005 [Rhizobium yanglingense]|nr:hypothetical protein AJ87_20005 [Rhizobium yanglingense]